MARMTDYASSLPHVHVTCIYLFVCCTFVQFHHIYTNMIRFSFPSVCGCSYLIVLSVCVSCSPHIPGERGPHNMEAVSGLDLIYVNIAQAWRSVDLPSLACCLCIFCCSSPVWRDFNIIADVNITARIADFASPWAAYSFFPFFFLPNNVTTKQR